MTATGTAGPFDRDHALERLAAERFDLLVIGGGVTGCGVALDAAARGLSTALVEARDFASGTSSKSSKLVHGGLRYLQQHDYRLVYEALHERQRLLRNAPHLVHPLPFLVPLFGKGGVVAKSVAKAYSGALWIYDLTGGLRIGKRHRRVGAAEALAHFPSLRTDRLVAAFVYWDAQADDARLTLALARTAAAYGAAVANYSPVSEIVEEGGRACGARLDDGTVVRARAVVNAGGVWTEQVGHLSSSPIGVRIRPAKGIHVAVPAARLPCDHASVLSVPGDRRSIFVVPWAADELAGGNGLGGGGGDGFADDGHGDRVSTDSPGRYTYIGTTDTDYDGPLDDPPCTAGDIAYLLDAVNAWTGAALTPSDVTGSWAGLRPLIGDAPSERTADLSRRHKVIVSGNGMVTVTGGKLTTYRKMAADTVSAAIHSGSFPGRLRRAPTSKLTLSGGASGGRPSPVVVEAARSLGITDGIAAHLAGRHGSDTGKIVQLCAERPELAEMVAPSLPYLRAEVVHAARQEMARTLDDVLSRRMRASMLNHNAALDAAPAVADLLATELGWSPAERSDQLAAFAHSTRHEVPTDTA